MTAVLLRLKILAACGILFLGGLSARLYQMQVVQGATYERQARLNAMVPETIAAVRGRIVDAHGRVLVSNEPRFYLAVVADEVRNIYHTTDMLAAALGTDAAAMLKKMRRLQKDAPNDRAILQDPLTPAQMARLVVLVPRLRGVYLDAQPVRRYPCGTTAAHLLGYVGEISKEELDEAPSDQYAPRDLIGKSGLEKSYDLDLRGRKGVRYMAVDAAGRTGQVLNTTLSEPGNSLILTLDIDLQRQTEIALQKTLDGLAEKNHARGGGVVVAMNAKGGGILAIASLPQYDPRLFSRGLDAKQYRALAEDKAAPLLNRATRGLFSPGSTFKLVTSSAALQENLCTSKTYFYCGGSYKGANCFVRRGHGTIDFTRTLAMSCDVTYYMLGDRMGIDKLDRYASSFGYGKVSGVDLPQEEPGVLPSRAWKQKTRNEQWFDGDTINTSIGQGFLLVTPMQVAVATAAVANGGSIYRPHLLKYETTWEHNRVHGFSPHVVARVPVKPEHLAAVRAGMLGAVQYGTAVAAQTKLIQIAGKTGTVEANKTVDNPEGRNHVWFTCFAPYEKPQIVVTVFLEKAGGYGGQYAAPVAKEVIEAWYRVKHPEGPQPE